jgi:dihydroorotate dehydrogenase
MNARTPTAPSLDAAPGTPHPTYRLDRSFEDNVAAGPAFDGPWPTVPDTPEKSFLGLPVRSRFGVAAGILGNSRWLATYARLGFDILTFKTVRSVPRLCGTPPNWVWLDPASVARETDRPDGALVVTGKTPTRIADWTMGGSFGMPSLAPDVWQDDLVRARAAVGPGQVLVVSVVGTADADTTEDAIVQDFADLARAVVARGAQVVEANLSCPNVGKREGQVFLDTPLAARIARAVKAAVPGVPVLLKIGELRDAAPLAALIDAVAGHADGLVLMNAPARRIVRADGTPFFPAGRELAGVTGAAIHPIALRAVEHAAGIVARRRLPLAIVGVGGVTTPADAQAFIDAGAAAALSVTGAALDPLLAVRVKSVHPAL